MDLYLFKFNQELNRQVKLFEDIEDYKNYEYYQIEDINFSFGDGIYTTFTVNSNEDIDNTYDYAVLVDDNNDIISRWYIIESHYNTKGQFTLTLHNDVKANNLEGILNSEVYIEKGYVNNDSPLSIVKEPVQLNQIKQSETPIEDKVSKKGWVIVYKKTKFTNIGSNYDQPIADSSADGDVVQLSELVNVTGIDADTLRSLIINNGQLSALTTNGNTEVSIDVGFANVGILASYAKGTVNIINGSLGNIIIDDPNNIMKKINIANYYGKCLFYDYNREFNSSQMYDGTIGNIVRNYANLIRTNGGLQEVIVRALNNTNGAYVTTYNLDMLQRYNNRIINIDNINYLINISTNQDERTYSYSPKGLDAQDPLYIKLNTFNSKFRFQTENSINFKGVIKELRLTSTKQGVNAGWHFIAPTVQETVEGEPYYAMAIPVGAVLRWEDERPNIFPYFENYNNLARYYISKLLLDSSDEGTEGSSSDIIDAQWVPYFPFPEAVFRKPPLEEESEYLEGYVDSTLSRGRRGQFQTNVPDVEQGERAYARTQSCQTFMITNNKFTFNKNINLTLNDDRKTVSNCELYRFVSPNYQSKFDFNLASNGNVSFVVISCTYKPYQPIIYIQPQFSNLYGQNFTDDRGLIISGDFSLSQLNNRWKEYQLNNKLYDKVFSRDIQNLQFNQSQERIQGIANMIGSSAMSTASSAGAGALVGGVPGAIVGGVVGGVSSLTGGITDLALMGQRQQEVLNFAIDKFSLNIANIKAMPDIITKICALDNQFKIFPFIEYYSCSEEERGLFKNKMEYDGYTLGIVDNISNYIYNEEHYLKARIIRISDDLDNHITTDINNEFNKGLYIKGE